MRRLSLDHLTVVDATPSELVDIAARTGCRGICLFLHPMTVLPAMPDFALIGDTPERRATYAAMQAGGVALDLVYPFTLAGRTDVAAFEPALETTAWLGGRLANILCYDRDPARRLDRLGALADLAHGYGIALAIEFYAPSQLRSLDEALEVVDALATSGPGVGITLDLLHLMRSGGMPEDVWRLADPRIRIAQLCDGPMAVPELGMEHEAGLARLLPGEGSFDVRAFAEALAPDLPLSIEIPRQGAIDRGVPALDRAMAAVAATRRALGEGA